MSGTTPPLGNSYQERALSFVFQLGTGSFGATGQNTVKVDGLRAHCTILNNGFPSMHSAEMRIYGLTPTIMNGLTTLGKPRPMERNNTVTVLAGNVGGPMPVVYVGTITDAWQNFDSQPDTFLEVQSMVGTAIATAPVPPISFPGAADVATIMSGIATSAGRAFSNSGVSVVLANPYFCGTALSQAHELARSANINFDDDGQTFFIWPKDGAKNGAIPLISPASGLIGYPRFTSAGVALRMLYNPNIQFGGMIKVQQVEGNSPEDQQRRDANIPAADGTWYVRSLSHDLSSQIVNGPWFTDVDCDRATGNPST